MKLQAEDLMVGDWVMVYPWDENPWGPKKITDINFHSWEGADFCDSVGVEGWDELSLDQIKPIPLTPEILEKNGFTFDKKETESYSWSMHHKKFYRFPLGRGFYIEYDASDNTYRITDHIFIVLKYVHELQHALRLCKIEKSIEL